MKPDKLPDGEVCCNNKQCKLKDNCQRWLQRQGAKKYAFIIPGRYSCEWQIKKEGKR